MWWHSALLHASMSKLNLAQSSNIRPLSRYCNFHETLPGSVLFEKAYLQILISPASEQLMRRPKFDKVSAKYYQVGLRETLQLPSVLVKKTTCGSSVRQSISSPLHVDFSALLQEGDTHALTEMRLCYYRGVSA